MKKGRLHVVRSGLVASPPAWKKKDRNAVGFRRAKVAVPDEEPKKEAPFVAETCTSSAKCRLRVVPSIHPGTRTSALN